MRISNLEAWAITLPFKLSFTHALASRNYSHNVIVKATCIADDGTIYTGFGESVPRDYVTGETVDGALKRINDDYFPLLKNYDFSAPLEVMEYLWKCFQDLGLEEKSFGASWCAVELAVIDAVCKASGFNLSSMLAIYDVTKSEKISKEATGVSAAKGTSSDSITYGGVIPFGGTIITAIILLYFKFLGLKTVKMKVGRELDKDLQKLKLARKILGKDAILRVDANCAWTEDETIYFAEKMRQFKVNSIEQPLPAEDILGMKRLTEALPETLVADESLCTMKQARVLIENRACDAFNIRLSKVGGVLAASKIADMARENGLGVMMGAQVGESAILSAAARCWASVKGPFDNCEGSFNRYLLKQDLTEDDVTFSKEGKAKVFESPGIGISIEEWKVRRLSSEKSTDQSHLKKNTAKSKV